MDEHAAITVRASSERMEGVTLLGFVQLDICWFDELQFMSSVCELALFTIITLPVFAPVFAHFRLELAIAFSDI